MLASGPSGQNVNKVETAAFPCVERITLHLGTPPTANTKPRPSHLLPVVIIDIRLCTEELAQAVCVARAEDADLSGIGIFADLYFCEV